MAHKTPEARAAYYKAYYERTKEHQLERARKYGKEHRTERTEYEREWRANNPDKARKKMLNQMAKPRTDERRAYDREWKTQYYRKIKDAIFKAYGQRCVCCGESNRAVLTIDHINDNGAEHRRELGNKARGVRFYEWVIENGFPSDLQILCYNCNCCKPRGSCGPHGLLSDSHKLPTFFGWE